ncbi:hypothetical protein [Microbacterium sp. NPDC055599]
MSTDSEPIWHAKITYIGKLRDDEAIDVMDRLAHKGASIDIDRDFNEVSVVATLRARTPLHAAARLAALLIDTRRMEEVISLEVAAAEPALDRQIPEAYDYPIDVTRLSKLAGVSLLEARQFIRSPSFPDPVATGSNPLFSRYEVMRWLAKRAMRQ